VDNADILAIGKTRHGVRADARGPECTSCHGESNAHVTYKGSEKPPKPDRTFGKFTQTPAADREDACLACHKGGNRIQWQGSPHQSSEAVCSSCHKIHKGREQTKDKLAQAEICFACHKEQRADTHRASTHPIRAGGVGCSSCHNPHGSSGPKLLVQNTTNETCWTCHAEKRGPFLWEHPSASDDCMNCHTPHGSNNANLLKTRQPYLCSQCHIAGGHSTTAIRSGNDLGSGVITGAAASAAVQMIGKACTNCHTEVHGSNHPSGARFVR
jgi:DmsE family decaheme c-type cytochrome